MAEEYLIYADESDQHGKFFANFYGGVLVRSGDLAEVNECLAQKKKELLFRGEVKWQKVTKNYLQKYKDLIDEFFVLIRNERVKVRVIFTQHFVSPRKLDEYQQEHSYHILYYLFIKNAFGLRYSEPRAKRRRVRVYLDSMPDIREKNALFKACLAALSKSAPFRQARIEIPEDQIAEVNSHDHDILQLLDVVLGAI